MRKEEKIQLIIIFLVSTLFLINSVSALTASSENYSVSMFGTGIATGNPSSENYNSTALSTTQGTTRNAESDSYTVNLGIFNNTSPYSTVSITSYSISPNSAVVGSTIGLYISALNAQAVWAVITSPNAQVQTLTLNNTNFVYYLPAPSVVGTYAVVLYANSSTGTIASVVSSFELTAQTTSPSGGGGSSSDGGETTAIIEKCTYLWNCSPWGLCAVGKQKRECKNTGTCNGTENKPTEEMQCSETLFDIILNLKNIQLTEDRTLKFNIDLTEKKGVEYINVYIKHSIINKEGYEIFSQIETKTIKENLTYEKEIKEIKLTDGEYTLKIEIVYGYQQRASAEQKFKVENGKIEIKKARLRFNYNTLLTILIGLIMLINLIGAYRLLFIFKKNKYPIKSEKTSIKKKYFIYGQLALLIFALLAITLKTNITGKIISNLSSYSYNWRLILISSIIILFIVLLVIL